MQTFKTKSAKGLHCSFHVSSFFFVKGTFPPSSEQTQTEENLQRTEGSIIVNLFQRYFFADLIQGN